MEAQRKYGVPAAVTIAQAIVESGWGGSTPAAQDHNLFGIKGTGPAGGALYPTTEYVNGRRSRGPPSSGCITTSPRASTTMGG